MLDLSLNCFQSSLRFNTSDISFFVRVYVPSPGPGEKSGPSNRGAPSDSKIIFWLVFVNRVP